MTVDEGRERSQNIPGTETGMLPLYLARIEDLGQGDFVRVDCAVCPHVALLTPEFFCGSGLALRPRCSTSRRASGAAGCGARGRAVVSVSWSARAGNR